MKRLLAGLVVAAVLAAATACPSQRPTPEDCAHGVAVIWSSEQATPTHVELWDRQGKRASIKADVQGVFAAAEFSGEQPSQWFASNGNTIRAQTNISRLDRATCSVHSHRTKEAGAFGVAEVNDHVVLSHLSLGDRTWLEIYSQAGDLITTYQTGRDAPGSLGAAGENLLALTTENPDFSESSDGLYGPLRILILKEQSGTYTEKAALTCQLLWEFPPWSTPSVMPRSSVTLFISCYPTSRTRMCPLLWMRPGAR